MKFLNKRLWRPIAVISCFLAVVSFTAMYVISAYEPIVNNALGIETSRVEGGSGESVYYASDYASLEEMYRAKVQLLREIADEGVVLLKNKDDALPVKSGKVTIFGEDDLIYSTAVGGGAISSEMRANSTTLSEAFALNGLTVNTDAAQAAGSDLALVVIGRVAGEGADMPAGSLEITAEEREAIAAAKATGGTVAVLLSGDHPIEAAELEADDGIDAVLRFGNAGYRGAYGIADVICGAVSPSGKLVETYAADTMSSPVMMNFGDYSYTNGSRIRASQAKNYVSYNEGIYSDYRYYETRYEDCVLGQGNAASSAGTYASKGGWNYADEVVYAFGYGLSYTTFAKQIVGAPVFDEQARTASVTVEVTNTGSVLGKEVVQLYAQSPYTEYDRQNKVEKASVQLVGFEKTEELAPGESEQVEIGVNLQWLASYDYTNAETYIMDTGDYYFSVGGSAHEALNNILAAKGCTAEDGMDGDGDAALTYQWVQDAFDAETYSASVYTGADITNAFEDADINYWADGKITYLTRSDWQGTYPQTLALAASDRMISSLNDTKKYENGEWNDSASRAAEEEVTYQDHRSMDEVNDGLAEAGSFANAVVMRGKAYDDEGWNAILDSLSIFEMSRLVANGNYQIESVPSATLPGSKSADGPIGLNIPYVFMKIDPVTGEETPIPNGYTMTDGITEQAVAVDGTLDANMYASEPVLGATFNKSLVQRQGDFMGEDGLYCGAGCTYAPGANIHRSPYGGRATEYLSADPVHTSLMLAEMTKAANAKGMMLTVKHFVINDQEQNRIGVATFTNEQALREVYLRAFEGVMTYGQARGLMSSYNRIGLLSTSAEYDLLTTVLREEWGSAAFVITDLGSPTAGLYDGNASVVAGVSVMMNNGVYDDSSRSYVNQTLSMESIESDPVLLTATREACHRLLYNYIHSNVVNGISEDSRVVFVTPWWQPLLTAMEVVFTVIAGASVVLYLISVNKKKEQ